MRYIFFPNQKAREMIESMFRYSVLTDTDSICIFIIFICKPSCNDSNEKFRSVFEVIINIEVLNRFDTSHEFWAIANSLEMI